MKKKTKALKNEKEVIKRKCADLIMKTSDLKIMLKVLEDLKVKEFRVTHTKGDTDFNNLNFQFFTSESICFVYI